ncbi:hypothetical protein [Proteiniborus sp. MB09-C3]|uniref:hypothetical protein n=1 Tax=Proteiniborus sp. MB09-C3 TaxID=3050072 RepID=UPI0025547BFE|nr:hypothetical protein [Proteiniborus sp. MB09-C3]WIV10884.1 hypothetical protein QO263_12050 [Proteiniborus sp. MB09-C3]
MRPIDLNNLVPNTQLVSKVQHVENNKQKHFVHDQTIIQNRKFERELKKVNTTDKPYHVKIDNKQKGNKGKGNHGEKEEKSNQEKNEKEISKKTESISCGTVGTKIDIKI